MGNAGGQLMVITAVVLARIKLEKKKAASTGDPVNKYYSNTATLQMFLVRISADLEAKGYAFDANCPDINAVLQGTVGEMIAAINRCTKPGAAISPALMSLTAKNGTKDLLAPANPPSKKKKAAAKQKTKALAKKVVKPKAPAKRAPLKKSSAKKSNKK